MTKTQLIVTKKKHHWVTISHKRGIARYCMRCGKLRYMGRHKDYAKCLAYLDESIMVYNPLEVPEGEV